MRRNFKAAVSIFLVFAVLLTTSLSTVSVYAESSDEEYVLLSSVSEIETAVQVEDATVYVAAGNYIFTSGLSIAENVTIIGVCGEDESVIFDFDENLMSGQAGLYITNSGITLNNITFENSSSTKKPVMKIESDDVQLISCTVSNNAYSSALVIHYGQNIKISDCTIENLDTDTTSNYYSVIQVNSGAKVYVLGDTGIYTSADTQAHIMFVYEEDNSLYEDPNTLYFDDTVAFSGESSNAVIYSESPDLETRYDKVYIFLSENADEASDEIDDSDGTLLLPQESVVKDAYPTAETGWYCYNASAWTYKVLFISYSLSGFVYTNTDEGAEIVEDIAGGLLGYFL